MNPPGPEGCTNFEALVVDDTIALEGDEAFTIRVDGSMAMVTILDDDGKRERAPSERQYYTFSLQFLN